MLKQWSLSIAIVMALSTSATCLADEIAIQQDAQGVSYVTGGIGSEEVEALEAYKKQFNLYFLFSEGKIGRLVDDVDISILDGKKQTVFSLEHAAPRLLLSLPAGKYTAVASYQGHTQRYTFTITAKKSQRVILNWKNTELDEESREQNRQDEAPPEEIRNDTRADASGAS